MGLIRMVFWVEHGFVRSVVVGGVPWSGIGMIIEKHIKGFELESQLCGILVGCLVQRVAFEGCFS